MSTEPSHRHATLSLWGNAAALLIAAACIVNAFSYTMASANPLIQSDIWRYLDGFLGNFIEKGFTWLGLFARTDMGNDAHMPLHKLVLFLHTHYVGMDFRWEGILAVLCGVASVLLLSRIASARPVKEWRGSEYWLLAGLALVMLSLNSTNIYSWPRATMWYIPIVLACAYFGAVFHASPRRVAVLSFCLGVLLLKLTLPIVAAALCALALSRGADWRKLRWTALAMSAGFLLSMLFYWLCEQAYGAPPAPAEPARSLQAFANPGAWQAALLPLSDSVVHDSNLEALFGARGPWFRWSTGLLLLGAHAWFWWRIAFVRASSDARFVATTYIAVAVMLLFYGLLMAILTQRIPVQGFGYLHQPRYVLFYQLNLVALAILAYRELATLRPDTRGFRIGAIGALVLITSFGVLQLRLSHLAWTQVKYISRYYEQAAFDMGRLARNPDANLECLPLITICKFPVEKRRRIMGMLVRHELNLFSPKFQALHHLYPEGRPPVTASE